MELTEDDPRQIGPWTVEAVHFREIGRRSYAARIKELSADILLIDVPTENRYGLRANLQRAKSVFSLEIPRVLDSSLDSSPQWVASDPVSGRRLGEVLSEDGPLAPHQWAELAKTALIGCAALRSNDIQAFQLSVNTFVVDRNDIHMVDMWAGSFQELDIYTSDKARLSDLMSADDKVAIGNLLTLAMGSPSPQEMPTLEEVSSRGYGREHIDYINALRNETVAQRPSTERALRTIPGRGADWTVPVFALEKPGRQRAKRKAQKAFLWGIAGAVAIGAAAGAWLLFGNSGSQETPLDDAPSQASSDTVEPSLIQEARLTFTREGVPPVVSEVEETYDFLWCYPEENLRVDEIPDRLVFQELIGDDWKTDKDVSVTTTQSTDCSDGEVAVTFTAPLPTVLDSPLGWSSCQDFRVLIPRLSSDKRAPIRYCLQVRAYEPESS